MKKATRILVLLAGLAGAFAAPVSAALTDPAQIQTEAYVNLVQADQSLDAGRLDEALTQYKAARDYYLQLAKDFPGWEPRVIQYRKTYCDNQIADVERRKSGGQPEELPELEPLPATVPAPKPAAPEEAPVANRSAELDYLKSRVASLEADELVFDTASTLYIAQAGPHIQEKYDVSIDRRGLPSLGRYTLLAGARHFSAAPLKCYELGLGRTLSGSSVNPVYFLRRNKIIRAAGSYVLSSGLQSIIFRDLDA